MTLILNMWNGLTRILRQPEDVGSIVSLNRELSEIVVSVKMPITRDGTKRPREPLL